MSTHKSLSMRLLEALGQEELVDYGFETDHSDMLGIDKDQIKSEFERLFSRYGIPNVGIEEVSSDLEGVITVIFTDGESELEVGFLVDEEDNNSVLAMIYDADEDLENEDTDYIMIDLSSLTPPVFQPEGMDEFYVDLMNLNWLMKSALMSILASGLDDDTIEMARNKTDGYGNVVSEPMVAESMNERSITVIRGGKKIKTAVVKKVRNKRLTPKQKAGIRKAVMKRKSKKGEIQRKRKRSLKIRKSSGVTTPKLSKNYKVQGGSNR